MPDELPDFPLAPWELPPDSPEPLVAPATMRWHGKLFRRKTDWLVRVIGQERFSQAFLCAEDSLDQAKWRLDSPLLRGIGTQQDWNAEILARIRNSSYRRTVFFSDEGKNWNLQINFAGSSQLMGRVEGIVIERVNINWPFDFACATAEQIHAEVLRAWNDESSDLNFARRWLLLSEDEKYTLLVSWKRGGKIEFLSAMRFVLRAFAPQIADGFSQWGFYPTSGKFGYVEVTSGTLDDDVEQPDVLRLWGEAILEVFGPRWNEELTRQHSCACDQHWHGGSHYLVYTHERTAHEQLEAARELHLWLDERESRNELDAATLVRLRDTLR